MAADPHAAWQHRRCKEQSGEGNAAGAVATGPATVFVLTAARLDWTVHSATTVTTDEGTLLTLHIDPPAVVKIECKRAVQRWRWRNVQRKFPSLCLGNLD